MKPGKYPDIFCLPQEKKNATVSQTTVAKVISVFFTYCKNQDY
jgi:hypothetical protein